MNFSANPHHAFLNSDIQLSNNTSETIEISCKQLNRTWCLSPKQVINIRISEAGHYDFTTTNSEETDSIVIEDAIRLGGSKFRKTFAFENNPWFLVSMNDRTYFYNQDTKEQYLENDIAPEEIIELNEEYLLLLPQNNNSGILYSLLQRKIVRCISELIAYNKYYIVCKHDNSIEIIGLSKGLDLNIPIEDSKYAYYPTIHSVAYIKEQKCIVYDILSHNEQSFSIDILNGEKIIFLEFPYLALISVDAIRLTSLVSLKEQHISNKFPMTECNGVSLCKKDETHLDFCKRLYLEKPTITSLQKVHIRCYDTNTVYLERQYFNYISKHETGSLRSGKHTLETIQNVILAELENNTSFINTDKYLVANMFSCTVLVNEDMVYKRNKARYFQIANAGYLLIQESDETSIYTDKNELLYMSLGTIDKKDIDICHGLVHIGESWYDFTSRNLIQHKKYKYISKTNTILFFDDSSICYVYYNGHCRLLETNVDNVLYVTNDCRIVYHKIGNQCYYAHYNPSKGYYDNISPIVLTNFDSSQYSNALFTDTKDLILCKEGGNYILYNIKQYTKQVFEDTQFIIKGVNGYRPIVSFDKYKHPILKDPVTLQTATSEVLSSEYAFISPSGRYRVLFRRTFKNKILNSIVDEQEKCSFLRQYTIECPDAKLKEEHIANRYKLFEDHHELFDKYLALYKDEKDIQKERKDICEFMMDICFAWYLFDEIITIFDNFEKREIKFTIKGFLWFRNYVSFSYDDKYVAVAGRYHNYTGHSGYIGLYDIENDTVMYSNDIGYAVWRTAFSKNGEFAYYTSVPNTYIGNPTKERREKIENKNFLCFSPDGKYMALSEQGYRCYNNETFPGGCGHTQSTMVYIYDVQSLLPISNIHCIFGADIQGNKSKNVSYVSFSCDNNSILISSEDGIVLVYNLHIME